MNDERRRMRQAAIITMTGLAFLILTAIGSLILAEVYH